MNFAIDVPDSSSDACVLSYSLLHIVLVRVK
jgi:hypothetical protein